MPQQRPLLFEFNANKTFNNFFAGENQEALAHLQRCVNIKEIQFIYLWGEQGVGKSHLLQACCHLARQKNSSAFYLCLQQDHLPEPGILEGLEYYPLICLDNIGAIAGETDWEYRFFDFFNRIREHQQRLILSARQAPAELAIQLPDLKTRLSWGLTLKLKTPNESDRLAALTCKAEQMGFAISPKVGQFLLTHYSRDLPSLWQILEKLDHETLAAKRKLTIPFLKEILEKQHEP